jgi:hypothetical protein
LTLLSPPSTAWEVVYMLKVPKRAPDEALETMRKVFEERLNIKVVIRKINW